MKGETYRAILVPQSDRHGDKQRAIDQQREAFNKLHLFFVGLLEAIWLGSLFGWVTSTLFLLVGLFVASLLHGPLNRLRSPTTID